MDFSVTEKEKAIPAPFAFGESNNPIRFRESDKMSSDTHRSLVEKINVHELLADHDENEESTVEEPEQEEEVKDRTMLLLEAAIEVAIRDLRKSIKRIRTKRAPKPTFM